MGFEFNKIQNHDQINGNDIGLLITGQKNALSFWLDARIFSESHSSEADPFSLDGNFLELQQANEHGSAVSYASYSRYLANIEFNSNIGTFGFAQSALHWGPGTYLNLSLNQNSGSYPFAYWFTNIKNMRVMTFFSRFNQAKYGKWDDYNFNYLVGHRYEMSIGRLLNLGLSELLVSTKEAGIDAVSTIPIVPLFMQKGSGFESNNNGNISFDINLGNQKNRIYTEFLIDDIQSPSSLFDDFWANKWAFMSGYQNQLNYNNFKLISTLEYSRVEPWVYTHYQPYRLQFDNHGLPFGNPNGPNSQTLLIGLNAINKNFQFGTNIEWLWKGTDPGSLIQDPSVTDGDINLITHSNLIRARNTEFKNFLNGSYGPNWTIAPYFNFRWKWINLQSKIQFKDGPSDLMFRLMGEY